jgi:carboxylesterase
MPDRFATPNLLPTPIFAKPMLPDPVIEPNPPQSLSNEPFWLEAEGDRACLCLHGLGGGPYEMQLLGPVLQAQGWSVRAIRYPGHDGSSWQMPPSGWPEWYTAVEAAYADLAQRYRQVALLGFSTGCPLGLRLARRYPISRMVMLSPFLALQTHPLLGDLATAVQRLEPWWPHIPRLSLALSDRAMRQAADAAFNYRTFNLTAVKSALELIELVRPELPEITTPTLIVQPRGDRVVDPAGAEELYQRLGSSHKELRWLEQSDHIISLDVERSILFTWISEFLER